MDNIHPTRLPKRVPLACQRCRTRKLKCDVQRPCILCIRAKAECLPIDSNRWRVHNFENNFGPEPASKRTRTSSIPRSSKTTTGAGRADSGLGPDIGHTESHPPALCLPESPAHLADQQWHSSSTMSLVDGAFHLHNATAPGSPVINAIPGGQQRTNSNPGPNDAASQGRSIDSAGPQTPLIPNSRCSAKRPFSLSSRSVLFELFALLPERRVASLLVDTYFDRVHWFMLIFHQDGFRKRWQELYWFIDQNLPEAHHDVGFISTLLVVMGIGSLYTGEHRRALLKSYNVDAGNLGERIFSTMRARLLDIIALGSVDVVQTCILLGTYYLFHGSPELAWPVCGCGLRIAQALNLHRKIERDERSQVVNLFSWRNLNETRKRCWWAIYEIETFCSMWYGYPHSIKDEDCDVEPLDPSAKSLVIQSPESFDQPLRCETTLLSYKYFMSKLSVITKAALAELYRIGPNFTDTSRSSEKRTSNLPGLIQKVASFDAKLRSWHAEIPSRLQLENISPSQGGYTSLKELDDDIGASGPRFENHIYELQALALKLAYENARILVHRPLLSYKLVKKSAKQPTSHRYDSNSSSSDPFCLSLEACRDAALSTSEIISSPIANLVTATYAAAFVAIHTFTAGITLAILSGIEPLNPRSCEAKVGLQRLMAIQKRLTIRAPLASQGLDILQRLTKLMLEKEYAEMLDVSSMVPPPDSGSDASEAPGLPSNGHYYPENHNSLSLPTQNLLNNSQEIPTEQHQTASIPAQEVDPTLPSTGIGHQGNILEGEVDCEYADDPAMSQALFDLDRTLMGYAPPTALGDSGSFDSSSNWLQSENSVLAPEQAWIWGMENFPQFE